MNKQFIVVERNSNYKPKFGETGFYDTIIIDKEIFNIDVDLTNNDVWIDDTLEFGFINNGLSDDDLSLDIKLYISENYITTTKNKKTKLMKKPTINKVNNIEKVFNKVFKNQFGYLPLNNKYGNLKDEDCNLENFCKLQLMGYIPYVIECLNTLKKPNFRDVVKLKGTALPTSCGTLGSIYRQIGFIEYVGKTMVKGKNYDKFLTTNWDWFKVYGTKVLVKGNKYKLSELSWIDYRNKYNDDYTSVVPNKIQSKINKMYEDINNMEITF